MEQITIDQASAAYEVFLKIAKQVEASRTGVIIKLEGHPNMRLCNEEDIEAMRNLLSDVRSEYELNRQELESGAFKAFDKSAFEAAFLKRNSKGK